MGGPMPVPPMQGQPTAGQQTEVRDWGVRLAVVRSGRQVNLSSFMAAKKQTSAMVPQIPQASDATYGFCSTYGSTDGWHRSLCYLRPESTDAGSDEVLWVRLRWVDLFRRVVRCAGLRVDWGVRQFS